MKLTALLVITLAILWISLSGHFEPLLIAFGIGSITFVAWVANRMHVVDGESYPFGVVARLPSYWLWLMLEIIKSSIDTTRRVFGSRDAVKPVVFEAPARQQTDLGLVIHANSITLTPGTVSLAIHEHSITVHALHPDVAHDAVGSRMDQVVPEPRRAVDHSPGENR